MTKILFTGDSITDAGRNRELTDIIWGMGSGYPLLVKSKLNYDYPGKYEIINRGIAGHRITDLYARIKDDLINLKPDVLSVLIGINDVWHEIEANNGVDAEKFEKIYDMFLSEVKAALPDIKIILLGAYVTKSSATEESWDYFYPEAKKRAESAKRLAEKHGAVYVPLQEKFDEAVAKMPEPYWTLEGVHPTEAGYQLIFNEWMKGFEKLK